MTVYLHGSVNGQAVESYIRKAKESGNNVRALQIIKGSELMVKVAPAPYDTDMKTLLYSLSKSYTSVACGICMDEGLLSPDTLMCELFSDKMPENLTQWHKNLTLSHLLSMQSGHDGCVLCTMRWAEDSVKTFFEQPAAYPSGSVFAYSTAATCVCAAAVERVTGKKLADFLYEKMFSVMGIERPRWAECADGQTLGGTGLYLSCDDLAKFALMLKGKGLYNGKRIVSEEYLKLATYPHANNGDNGTDDWAAGYGYQFWMNARGGYRGDGAFGQLCLIFPDKDTAVILQSESSDMNAGFLLVYELLDNLYGEGSDEGLKLLCRDIYKPRKNTDGFNSDISFEIDENPIGLKKLRLFGEKLLHLELETDYGKKEIVCGNGEYILNYVMLKYLSPCILALDPEVGRLQRLGLMAAYELSEEGVTITLRHSDTPHVQRWVIDFKEKSFTVNAMVGELTHTHFKLNEINNAE